MTERALKGLIFDCDGTLVDTMPAYYESWRRLCQNNDLSLTEEEFYGFAGVPVPEIIAAVVEKSGKKGKLNEAKLLKEKASYGHESLKKMGQPAIECVVDIVKKYHGKLPMAVASSGIRSHVMESLRCNNLEQYFDAIICGEDVSNPKPAPDIFLLAAKKIGVDPSKCRGFEDGDVGLQALKAAGMEVVDVKLMKGYPRSKGITSKGKNEIEKDQMEDQKDVNIRLVDKEYEDESILSFNYLKGWILPILMIVVAMKVGEYLIAEAIADEAMNAD